MWKIVSCSRDVAWKTSVCIYHRPKMKKKTNICQRPSLVIQVIQPTELLFSPACANYSQKEAR